MKPIIKDKITDGYTNMEFNLKPISRELIPINCIHYDLNEKWAYINITTHNSCITASNYEQIISKLGFTRGYLHGVSHRIYIGNGCIISSNLNIPLLLVCISNEYMDVYRKWLYLVVNNLTTIEFPNQLLSIVINTAINDTIGSLKADKFINIYKGANKIITSDTGLLKKAIYKLDVNDLTAAQINNYKTAYLQNKINKNNLVTV